MTSTENPHRRSSDAPIPQFVNKWKAVIGAVVGALTALWISVTFLDDKIRKADRVPNIEEATLQLKVSQEQDGRRMDRIEGRLARVESKMEFNQREILEKLDVIVERGQ